MTKTLVMSAIIVSVILLSGTLGYTLSNPDAFASGQGKGGDKEKGKPGHAQEGCENAKEKSKGKTKNPHCEEELTCEDRCALAGEDRFQACIAAGGDEERCDRERRLAEFQCNITECGAPNTCEICGEIFLEDFSECRQLDFACQDEALGQYFFCIGEDLRDICGIPLPPRR